MILVKNNFLTYGGCLIVTVLAVALNFIPLERAMAKADIRGLRVKPVAFSSLPGWQQDDHSKAFAAFLRTCEKIKRGSDTLQKACRKARRMPRNLSDAHARAFFESYFKPHRVHSRRGLLTGYYEPELLGSKVRTAKFKVPLYRRPAELVGLHTSSMRRAARRAGLSRKLTYAKRTRSGGLKPFMTRQQIESGGFDGRNLEVMWLADPVDVFFLHIQGSGRILLPDGTRTRVGFDGKNGYDYSSVGRGLVRAGHMAKGTVTLDSVKAWLRNNPVLGRRAMWRNKSFIFFRELPALSEKLGPIGAQGVPLIGGRSLAVDRRHYRLGLPIFLSVRNLRNGGHKNFRRLMIAQDTGTAIKGPRRGDIFWGSGDKAGDIAGRTYHKGEFYVLLPRKNPLSIKVSKKVRKTAVSNWRKVKLRQPAKVKPQKAEIVRSRTPAVFTVPGSHAFSRYKSHSF